MPINDEIFARMDELSPAERKVARTLLASYPSAGLSSAASLARSAGTSAPTVLRLLSRLGIGSYPDFQQKLREEISNQINSPFRRSEVAREPDDDDLLGHAIARRAALVGALAGSVPPSEFDRAVRLLTDKPRQVLITGGYFSRYLAMLLAAELDEVIPGVDFVEDPVGRQMGKLLSLGNRSVVVIMDFRRYEESAAHAAQAARHRGAAVVVITDQGLSPAADHADVVLPVKVDGIPFDAMVGLLALTETLVEAVLQGTGDRGLNRMKDWETSVRIQRAVRVDPGR
ncbi:MAG: MurR/RpiR family transcriptional regulator [Microlunatus sp.]|nr:MurR/RpiR family transcriptional regulator [Microlunatus sp.]